MRPACKMWIATAALSAAMAAGHANAGEIGWLDGVNVDMVDTAYGWVCENEDPYMTPSYGSIDVYLDAPADKGGYYYGNYRLQQYNWGYLKQNVNAAGYCGSNPYVAFRLEGWFSEDSGGPNTIYLYWRDSAGHLTPIGGSGLAMTKIGMNP